VPAGVLLGLGRESARGVGAGGTSAGPCLLGYGHGAAVLTGQRSPRATAGTLDHTGSAVGHRAGTARNNRGAGTLTARDDRRDHSGSPHRPPVTGADATRSGNVRGSGEATGLGLVGVGALMRVAAAALLTSGEALGPGTALGSTPDDALGARVTAGRHESVCAGVGAGLYEAVRTGVRAGLNESM
jgi:hypothetical protein